MNIATKLNNRLSAGGIVQITTYMKSTIYTQRHIGWFSVRAGNLFVRRGRKHDCLGPENAPGVAICLGWFK